MWPFNKKKPKSGLDKIAQIKEIEKLGYQITTFDYRKTRGRRQFVVEFQGTDGQILGIMWIDGIQKEEWEKIIKYCNK